MQRVERVHVGELGDVLRHTGNQLAAMSGASTRELMRRRTGHGSMRVAMIYQHAGDERDRAIADRLGQHIRKASSLSCANGVERATGIEPA